MSEIFRVLKPGGEAVLQTPYSNILYESFKDLNISNDMLRKEFYGLEDHVRVYGQDLFRKIKNVGFILKIHSHGDLLNEFDSNYWGVNFRENLILVQKPET